MVSFVATLLAKGIVVMDLSLIMCPSLDSSDILTNEYCAMVGADDRLARSQAIIDIFSRLQGTVDSENDDVDLRSSYVAHIGPLGASRCARCVSDCLETATMCLVAELSQLMLMLGCAQTSLELAQVK
jgi:hypothetical protein